MAGSSSRIPGKERRPVTADNEEKMVVSMEYSTLPEVVPPAHPALHAHSFGSTSPAGTPVISPMTPQSSDAFLQPNRRPKPPTPWSPASFENLYPSSAPPPYDQSGPPSPSTSHMSHLSHLPLHPQHSHHHQHHHSSPSFSSQTPFFTPASIHDPLAPPTMPGFGGGMTESGRPVLLGPVAAARLRRKWCIWVCVAVLILSVAVVAGIVFAILHIKLGKDNNKSNPSPVVVTSLVTTSTLT